MQLYRQFIKAGTALPLEVYLVELLWIQERIQREVRVISKRNVFEIHVATEEGRLIGKMIRAQQGNHKRVPMEMPEAGKLLGAISISEIEAFVTAVGDKNPLHQGESAIVPGCMLLDLVRKELPEARGIEIRFKAPIFANQEIHLFPLGERDYQLLAGDGVVAGIIRGS